MKEKIKCVACEKGSVYWTCEDCVVKWLRDERLRERRKTKRRTAKAIFDRLDEIRNREITSPEELNQQETDYQNEKKKWCDDENA